MNRLTKTLASLVLVIALGACSTFGSGATTDQQRFYALKSDYKALLSTLVAYRDSCEAKTLELRLGCDGNVRIMQGIVETDLDPAYKNASAALDAGSSIELAAANAGLQAAISRLSQYVIANQIKP